MMKLYVTFRLGSVLGGYYLVAHTDNERNLRIALNATKLPWCSLYSEKHFDSAIKQYGLVPLEREFEAFEFDSGPRAKKGL